MWLRPAVPADAAVVAGIPHHGWTDSYTGMTRTTRIAGGSMTDVRYLWDLRGRVLMDHQDTR